MTTAAAQTDGYPIDLDPGWGERYGDEWPDYSDEHGVLVWMFRKGQRCRFFDQRGRQVGPEHKNVAPALYWAAAAGWIDPRNPDLSIACILEIRRNSVSLNKNGTELVFPGQAK